MLYECYSYNVPHSLDGGSGAHVAKVKQAQMSMRVHLYGIEVTTDEQTKDTA